MGCLTDCHNKALAAAGSLPTNATDQQRAEWTARYNAVHEPCKAKCPVEGAVPPSAYTKTSGLPEWGQNFLQGIVGKYGKQAFGLYANAMDRINQEPSMIRGEAGTQQARYGSQILAPTTAALTQGIGRQFGGAMTGQTLGRTLGTVGTGAAASTRDVKYATQNWKDNALMDSFVNRAKASNDFSGMIADYLKLTNVRRDPTAWLRELLDN